MRTLLLFIVMTLIPASGVAADDLPPPWKHQDIGMPQVPGKAEESNGQIVLQGTMDLWGTADGCHVAWQPCRGDAELVARVTAMDNPGGVAHAKSGLCLRESLDPGSRHVTLCVTASDGTQFLYRDKTDGKTTRVMPVAGAEPMKGAVGKGQFPCWLKLVRKGNEFRGYESLDGESWNPSGQITLELPEKTIAGLTASSHKKDVLTKVIFDHVKFPGVETGAPNSRAETSKDGSCPICDSTIASSSTDFEDTFHNQLGPGWSWIREDPSAHRVTDHGLEVRVQPGNMWGSARDGKNLLVRAAPDPDAGEVDVTVTVTNTPLEQYEQADLVWYFDDGNMVKCGQERVDGKLRIVMGRKEKDRCRTIKILPLETSTVSLRLIVKGNEIRGQFRPEGAKEWTAVGQTDLPGTGPAQISIQIYKGTANVERWVKVNDFAVRQR